MCPDEPAWPSASQRTPFTIAYAAVFTPALPAGDALYNIGALTGAITINNPSGTPVDGQTIQFRMAQDATGAHAITWGAAYVFGSDVTAAMIPATANAKWTILFAFNANAGQWQALSIARGF